MKEEDFKEYPIIDSTIEESYWYCNNLCVKGKYNKIKDVSNDKDYYYNLYFSDIKDSDIADKKTKNL